MVSLFRRADASSGLDRVDEAKRPKVFGIGFHKTGTTSLAVALSRLGYRVTGPNGVEDPDIAEQLHDLARKLIDQYDAFQDNPWPILYRWVDDHVPDARFVLTVRSESDWLRSVVRHFGDEVTPMREMIYGLGAGSPIGNEDIYLERYRRHNREVMEHFSGRDQLLVLRLTEGEGWEELCPFLGDPIPDEPFPHANSAQARAGPRRLIERMVGRLAAVVR